MSLIGQRTKSDFLEWDKLQLLTRQLETDKDYKFCLLITIGMTTGLRISDILSLTWEQVLGKDHLELTEKKTKKYRKIPINPQLRETTVRISNKLPVVDPTQFIFLNRWGSKPISSQYVNWKLKELMKKYQVVKDTQKIKSHSLRKSFGRRIWENSGRSERGLIMLNEIFNHSNIRTTKIYLGIREKELFDVYQNL
jgi:integrase